MADFTRRALKVFLCHASADKPVVRDLYKRLVVEGVDAWLDTEKLIPGQDWQLEIPRAVKAADVVVVCLSKKSVTKEGYVQREIGFALDAAQEKPAGTIFLIPVRLEDCSVPELLNRWQWVDLFEDNGFLRLLLSLKIRADIVGAVIEPPSYEGEDIEIEKRLDQLYTDGLAAFHIEDWDRACRRFQAILRERPSYKSAAEKLAQSERQRNLAKLYARAGEAYRSEDWSTAIQTLEDLMGKSGDYKDTLQLLTNAKKQKQLKELYTEAKTLYAAEKWQAVVRVFEKIFAIEPTYADPDGMLAYAQNKVAEIKRLDELNEIYSVSVREIEASNWYEARRLLEQVHKAQTGFLETERLLKKVENEILRIEDLNERNIQISTLYEQAHGLVRSGNWREALGKIEEIQRLDPQFEDKDGIAEQATSALEIEDQKVQKQNQLAAMYAEALRLLKQGHYKESLVKWYEVKEIDPKYPDRQKIQATARRKLAEGAKPRITKMMVFWIALLIMLSCVFLATKFGFPLLTPPLPTSTVTTLPIPTETTFPTPTKENPTYLADLDPASLTVGHMTLGIGKYPWTEGSAVRGESLRANGVDYPHALMAHAPSEIIYHLTKNFSSFSSSIYIDGYTEGSYTCGGTASFIILLDNEEIYRSPALTYSEPITLIDISEIPINGGTTLTLKTDPLGNPGCDWTVWADPYLVP